VIYVPVYNPGEIYGRWPDHDYLPVFVPPPPNFYSAGIGFSIGFRVTGALWGWGYPDWRQHEVVVDPKRYSRITTSTDITGNHVAIENNTWNRDSGDNPCSRAGATAKKVEMTTSLWLLLT
jgi:hypothetical protein